MVDVVMPNGDTVSFPDDMPREQIKGMIASKFPDVVPKPDQGMAADQLENLEAMQAGAADMATFGFWDEGKAGLQALASQATGAIAGVDPLSYDHFLEKQRNTAQNLQENNPYAYGTGQVAGAIGTPALAAPKMLTKGAAYAASKGIVPKIATYSGLGAASGGLYGAGSGETTEERIANVPYYGGLGGLGGTGGAVLGGLAQRAYKLFGGGKVKPSVINPNQPTKEILDAVISQGDEIAPVSGGEKAFSAVKKQLKKDLGDNYETALKAYKDGDISLIELNNSRTNTLAQGAAQFAGGKARAQEFFDPKVGGSYDRVISNIGKNVSDIENYHTTADDLVNIGRKKAAPLYEKAYEGVVDVSDDQTLSILTSPEIQTAIKKAQRQFPSELEGLAEDNVKVLDYAKRTIDDDINTAIRAGKSNLARSRTELKNQLLETIDRQVPAYKKARAVSGDYLSINDAMEQGRKALKTDPEILGKTFKSFPDPEKEAFRIGLGKSIRDEVGKVNEGANPYKRILGSPEKQKRISAVLSPNQYKELEKGLKAEDRLFKMRNEILGGSPTAGKQEAKNMIEGGVQAVENMSQIPRKSMTAALQKFKSGLSDKTASKVSEILYETDPIKKLAIFDKLTSSRELTPAEIKLVKRVYFEAADQFDVMKATSAISGGSAIPQAIEKATDD